MKRKGIRTDCQVQGVALLLSSEFNKLSIDRLKKWVDSKETSWWAIVHVVLNVRSERTRGNLLGSFLETLLSSSNQEIARAAAYRLCMLGVAMPNIVMDEHGECRSIFQAFGKMTPAKRKLSRINELYSKILAEYGIKTKIKKVDWRLLLGDEYEMFDIYAANLYAESRKSGDLFIQLLDAAWEPVIQPLWKTLNCTDIDYDTGNKLEKDRKKMITRSAMFRKNTDLRRKVPAVCRFVKATNDLRNHGHASHRKNSFTGTRNRPVTFNDVQRLLKLLPPAIAEISLHFPE